MGTDPMSAMQASFAWRRMKAANPEMSEGRIADGVVREILLRGNSG
jgi:hypothetical protein